MDVCVPPPPQNIMLDREGEALMKGISTPLKETLEDPSPFPLHDDTEKRLPSTKPEVVLTRHRIYWYLHLGLPSPRTVRR